MRNFTLMIFLVFIQNFHYLDGMSMSQNNNKRQLPERIVITTSKKYINVSDVIIYSLLLIGINFGILKYEESIFLNRREAEEKILKQMKKNQDQQDKGPNGC